MGGVVVDAEVPLTMPMRCVSNTWERRGGGDNPKGWYEARFEGVNSETPGVRIENLRIEADEPLPFIAGHEYLLTLQTER